MEVEKWILYKPLASTHSLSLNVHFIFSNNETGTVSLPHGTGLLKSDPL